MGNKSVHRFERLVSPRLIVLPIATRLPNRHAKFAHLVLEGKRRKYGTRAIALFAFFFSQLPIAGSATPKISESVESPAVYETGYEIDSPIISRAIHWVDNARVLFAGRKTVYGTERQPIKLYVWELTSKSATFYGEGNNLCVNDGFVQYTLRVDKLARTETVKEGPFKREKEVTRALRSDGKARANGFTCKSYSPVELSPPAAPGHRIIALREGDGYLDMGSEVLFEPVSPIDELILYRPGNNAPVKLPILLRERLSVPRYSSFINAYLIYPTQDKKRPDTSERVWPKDQPQPIYILAADGTVATTTIPPGKWSDVHLPSPTRAGLLFAGGNFYRSLGLYLLRSNNVLRVDTGAVREIAVSPDGCKAAVGIQNRHLETGAPTNLRIFMLCR